MASQAVISEPFCYEEAVPHPLWIEAMKKELAALDSNQTWNLVDLPK